MNGVSVHERNFVMNRLLALARSLPVHAGKHPPMNQKWKKAALEFLCLVLTLISVPSRSSVTDQTPEEAVRIKKYTPEVDKIDAAPAPATGGILMVGSSIFRKWESCHADMAPLPVTNRAFGGSQTADQLYFFDRIVPSSHASLIVWYCGSNDIKGSQDPANLTKTPPSILKRTRQWVDLTREALPQARILLVSVIRAPQKRESGLLKQVDEVNRGLIQLAGSIPGVSYVDVNPALETSSGDPRRECYVADKLHLTPEGYRAMTSVLKPEMERLWKPPSV